MKYHLFKTSRTYYGYPYKGPAWMNGKEPAETDSIIQAKQMQEIMNMRNSVGFYIYDTESGEIV